MDALGMIKGQSATAARESAFEAAHSRLQEAAGAGNGAGNGAENGVGTLSKTTRQPANGMPSGGLTERQKEKIQEAAIDFEAVFLSQMIAPMFEGLDPDPVFGGGSGERIFNSMVVEEYGKALARTGGVGLADAVASQLIAAQESRQ